MLILFPSHPLDKKEVDPQFEAEMKAAQKVGFDCALLNTEAIDAEDYKAAIKDLPDVAQVIDDHWDWRETTTDCLLRGWMMTVEDYEDLFSALSYKGYRLINDYHQYENCHYLPNTLPALGIRTPETKVIPMRTEGSMITKDGQSVEVLFSEEEVVKAAHSFGPDTQLIIKDFVKSEKQAWPEGCFIERVSARGRIVERVREFLALRGDRLQGGLVLRRYIPFEGLDVNPAEAAPKFNEHRIFWYKGEPIFQKQYQGALTGVLPNADEFRYLTHHINSQFFTMDLVRRQDNGEWMILELGDGQVAGLPDDTDPEVFYRSLYQYEKIL